MRCAEARLAGPGPSVRAGVGEWGIWVARSAREVGEGRGGASVEMEAAWRCHSQGRSGGRLGEPSKELKGHLRRSGGTIRLAGDVNTGA